jgi:HAD superfamily hydrolase (TIGR01450 family)
MALHGAIVDLDGTVYRGDELVDGARQGIDALRAAGVDVLFFSNNPLKDGAAYLNRLSELGFDVTDLQACSAGVVTTEHLVDNHAEDRIFCIGADDLREQFLAADLTVTDDPENAEVLVASWTAAFDYGDMRDALAAADDETPFLGTDPDRTFPMPGGTEVPGSGAIVGSVAATIGRDPDAVLGKPSPAAREAALSRLGVSAEECLIVGDRLDTDLRMGQDAGMTTVLVLSGVAERADIDESDVSPDYVIDSLGDIRSVLDAEGESTGL